MTPEIEAALVSVATWAATGFLRWVSPDFWRDLDKRIFRLAVVATVAVCVAVATGIAQGLGLAAIARLALTALAGSVLLRQTTKGDKLVYDGKPLSRNIDIRTKL